MNQPGYRPPQGYGYPPPRPPPRKAGFGAVLLIGVGSLVLLFTVAVLGAMKRSRTHAAVQGARSAAPGASASAAPEATVESMCGLPADAKVRYVERSRERQDLPGAPRLAVRVTVPTGMTQRELQGNICHAAVTAYSASAVKLGALTVFAYTSAETTGPYDAGKAVYAPGGVWERADPNEPLRNWKLEVEMATAYFDATAGVAENATVTLADENGLSVLISNNAERWGDAELVANVPNGTKARILEHREFQMGDRTVLRYRIETTGRPTRRGWVHDYAVHPSDRAQ